MSWHTWREIHFYAYIAAPFIILPIITALVLYNRYKSIPDATQQIDLEAPAQDFCP